MVSPEGVQFAEYVAHGWSLVPLRAGTKKPALQNWGARDRCISDARSASVLTSAGLAHAYSGTCALDIDDVDAARGPFADHGVDIDALLTAPDAVRIDSGRAGHHKLLYRVPSPLPSTVLVTRPDDNTHAAQMRCATRSGNTVQDVLPPSIHPDTGHPYRWHGDWRAIPEIPELLLRWWRSAGTEPAESGTEAPTPTGDRAAVLALLSAIDPDCEYGEWIRVGMAIHHESAGADWGLQAWDAWSSNGAKYRGLADLRTHWRTFGKSSNPVTLATLKQRQVAAPEDFPQLPLKSPKKAVKHTPFRAVHVAEWAQRPPPEWLVHGLLPQADLAMLYGSSGTGKSFFALDIAMAVARGIPWRGMTVQQAPVLWLAAEAPGSMRNRALAYARVHEIDLDSVPLWIVGDTPSLADGSHVAALAKEAARVQARLVVIDTLAASSDGTDENNAAMGAVLAGCRRIGSASNALVLLVHHLGKDASRGARGWSGIPDRMDVHIKIECDTETPARIATVTKQRDAEDGQVMPFMLRPVDIDMQATSCVVEHMAQSIVQRQLPHAVNFSASAMGPHIQVEESPMDVSTSAAFAEFAELM